MIRHVFNDVFRVTTCEEGHLNSSIIINIRCLIHAIHACYLLRIEARLYYDQGVNMRKECYLLINMFYISLNFEEQIKAFKHCKPQRFTDSHTELSWTLTNRNNLNCWTKWTYDLVIFFFLIWFGNDTLDVIKEDEPADVTENSVQYKGTRCYLYTSVHPTKHKSRYATLDMLCLFACKGVYSM